MSAALEAWLEVLQAGQTSSAAWQEAIAHCGDIMSVRQASPTQLAAFGLNDDTLARLKKPDRTRIALWQDWLEQPGHALLTCDAADWPKSFAETGDAPLALWLRGLQSDLLGAPQIAIVGSRSASAGGAANARSFAAALGRSGLCITSGLAAGIDAAAHQGALGTPGTTLAVLGNGIDHVYPRENVGLAERIANEGLIVSEYPPGARALRHQFPARNRIIASLSLGVLVVEAGVHSGSLITARLAGERGREIFAIPGSIHNPVARGCHRLIREGARLVETADDVLSELAPALRRALADSAAADATSEHSESTRHNCSQGAQTLGPEYSALLEQMGFDPIDVGAIAARSALTTAEVSSMLLLLELEGHVEALPGGHYARID